jgi:hypothetical protein
MTFTKALLQGKDVTVRLWRMSWDMSCLVRA